MTQYAFIRRTAEQLGEQNLNLIKGDVFKFLAAPHEKFDFIFADPPYDLPRFGEIPQLVLQADILKPDGFFIIEHSRAYDLSTPHIR